MPPPVTDWENYGGITRSIRLISTPETYVDSASLQLTRDGQIAVAAHLDGPQAANRALHLRIADLAHRSCRQHRCPGQLARHRRGAPRAGSMVARQPKLYDCRSRPATTAGAIASASAPSPSDGPDILLNGKPVFLRGISLHEEEFGTDPTRAITPVSGAGAADSSQRRSARQLRAPGALSALGDDDARRPTSWA